MKRWTPYILMTLITGWIFAAQVIIDVGTVPDDGTGDPLRTAFQGVNSNFTELYNFHHDYATERHFALRRSRSGLRFADGDMVTVANGAFELGTSDFTLHFVARRTGDNTASSEYIYYSHFTGPSRWNVRIDVSDNWEFQIVDAAWTVFTETSSIKWADDSETYSWTITIDRDGNATFYRDAVSQGTLSVSAYSAIDIGAANTNIGRVGGSTAGNGFLGDIFDFIVFDKLLTPTEILDLCERGDIYSEDQWANVPWAGDFEAVNGVSLVLPDRSSAGFNGTLVSMNQTNILRHARAIHINAPAPATGEKLFGVHNGSTEKASINEAGLLDQSGLATDTPLIRAAADAITGAGTVSHQIPVNIGGTTYYIVAYTHGT